MFDQDRQHGSRGQALVEFAIIAPIMLTLLLIAVDTGRLFSVYIGAQNAAREGAAFAAVHPGCPSNTGGACADPANATYVARQELDGDTALTVGVTCTSACVSSTTREGNVVTVTVSYPFELLFPGLGGQSLTLEASSVAVIQ